MPDFYLNNDDLHDAQATIWQSDAHRQVADQWAAQAMDTAPSAIAQGQQQQQAQQQADEWGQQAAATVQQAPPDPQPQPDTSGDDWVRQQLDRIGSWTTPASAPDSPPAAPAPVAGPVGQATPAPTETAPAPPNDAAPHSSDRGETSVSPRIAPTTAEISGAAPGSGRLDAAAQSLLQQAGDLARARYGDEGARALQAVLVTEGGLNGARGDNGKSASPLQLFGEEGGRAGQLNNLARQLGMSLADTRDWAEQHPLDVIDWALGTPQQPGYLGSVIKNGLEAGLTGPALATHVQRTGQVSVSPERAGQNYSALFAGGSDAQTGQTAQTAQTAGLDRPSQFGLGLSYTDALAYCGPVAAIALARKYGNDIPLEAVKQAAADVGWTAQTGMAGPQSEVELLKRMGVAAHVENGVDLGKITRDTSAGNPVIISTPGHYFTVDQVDPKTGALHVGTSGTDLKGGSEWMSLDQMQQLMGTAQGTLYVDNPTTPTPSIAAGNPASQQPDKPWYEQVGDAVSTAVASALKPILSKLDPAAAGDVMRDALTPPAAPTQHVDAPSDGGGFSLPAPSGQSRPLDLSPAAPAAPLDRMPFVPHLPKPGEIASVQDAAQQAGNDALNRSYPTLGPGGLGLVDPRIGPSGEDASSKASSLVDATGVDLGRAAEDLKAGAPAQATLPMATTLGGAAAGGGAAYATTDPNDPNRGAKIGAAAVAGGAAGYVAGEYGPRVSGGVRVPSWITAPATGAPVTKGEAFNLYRMGNLISSPLTVAKVAVNAVVAPAWTLVRDTATAGRLNPETIAPEWLGAYKGFADAGGAMLNALTHGTQNAATGVPMAISERTAPGLARVAARIWELPGNVHGALAAGAKSVVSQAELGRLAALDAQARGLHGSALLQDVQQTLANPPQHLLDQADAAGARAALQGDLGTLGKAITQFRNDTTKVGSNIVLPILKIPLNFTTQNLEKSPVGLLGTALDVARGAAGDGPYAAGATNRAVTPVGERLANNVLGTAVTAFLVGKALEGNITGDGPSDPKALQQLRATGWQPNSIQVPGLGWVGADKLPPGVSEAVRIAGALADVHRYGAGSGMAEQAGSLATRLASQFATAPGLDAAGQIYELLKGGQGSAAVARYLGQQASSFIPMSAAVRGTTNQLEGPAPSVDRTAPFLDQVIQNVASGLPIRDQGPAVKRPAAMDPVTQAFNAVGLNPDTAPKSIQIPGYSDHISLSAEESKQYAAAVRAQLEQMGVSQVINDPSFTGLPAKQQAAELRQYLTAAERQAASDVVSALPADELNRRVQDRANATPTPYAARSTTSSRSSAATVAPTAAPARDLGPIQYPNGEPTKVSQCTLGGDPDSACTPGSFHQNADALNHAPRTVSQSTKNQVYAAYGIASHKQGDYEIDHLVPLALGGSNDRSNLWPQAKAASGAGGFNDKDIVELYLYEQVRNKAIPLEQAQHDVVQRWRDVYAGISSAERQRLAGVLKSLPADQQAAITD